VAKERIEIHVVIIVISNTLKTNLLNWPIARFKQLDNALKQNCPNLLKLQAT